MIEVVHMHCYLSFWNLRIKIDGKPLNCLCTERRSYSTYYRSRVVIYKLQSNILKLQAKSNQLFKAAAAYFYAATFKILVAHNDIVHPGRIDCYCEAVERFRAPLKAGS